MRMSQKCCKAYLWTIAAAMVFLMAGMPGQVWQVRAEEVQGTEEIQQTQEIQKNQGTEQSSTGWRFEEGEWFYYLEDGTKNRKELTFDDAVYEFEKDGTLQSAHWIPNTGGGAYPVVCYDEEEQALFDQLNDEKKDLFFEEYPDREDEYDGDDHAMYDRYAGFKMDVNLNKIASHRLEMAMENGYSVDSTIPGEGSLKDYLGQLGYRKHATSLELYIQRRDDADDAFDKVMDRTQKKYDTSGKHLYSLEYYRSLGMAHTEKDGAHYFMIVLMR